MSLAFRSIRFINKAKRAIEPSSVPPDHTEDWAANLSSFASPSVLFARKDMFHRVPLCFSRSRCAIPNNDLRNHRHSVSPRDGSPGFTATQLHSHSKPRRPLSQRLIRIKVHRIIASSVPLCLFGAASYHDGWLSHTIPTFLRFTDA